MGFDIPKHAIPAFMRLAEKEDIAKNVWMWGQYMDSFDTPIFIETGEHLYETQIAMFKERFDEDSSILTAQVWRMALLAEMFENGIHLNVDVADRLSVCMTSEAFVISHESIGRYREWCWIDQRANESFRLDRPFDVMLALARRFKNPHDNTTRAV